MPVGKHAVPGDGKHWWKKKKVTCRVCEGTGWNTRRVGMGSGAADFVTKKCRNCRGKGTVRQ